jgi:hypothetical protein
MKWVGQGPRLVVSGMTLVRVSNSTGVTAPRPQHSLPSSAPGEKTEALSHGTLVKQPSPELLNFHGTILTLGVIFWVLFLTGMDTAAGLKFELFRNRDIRHSERKLKA